MAISYTKKTWLDSPNTTTPLSAANLQIMDDGIEAACVAVDAMPSVRAAALTSDFSGTQSNTTLEDVTGLSIAAAANEVITFSLVLIYEADAADDLKVGFAVPSGATMEWGAMAYTNTSGTLVGGGVIGDESGSLSVGATGTSPRMVVVNGVMVNSSTAGDLQVQVAQNSSGANAITVNTGSVIRGEVW